MKISIWIDRDNIIHLGMTEIVESYQTGPSRIKIEWDYKKKKKIQENNIQTNGWHLNLEPNLLPLMGSKILPSR